ncbi:MAG: hypothetical protein HQL93_05235 [Magnetococcales bacterium]|nr:hypothetical protein [Magnetococcales bacterium]
MEHKTKPLFGHITLIAIGAIFIMGLTIYGIHNDPGELIRNDLLLGPIIATGRIVIPLFFTLGVIYLLANITKCRACGRILFWKKKSEKS